MYLYGALVKLPTWVMLIVAGPKSFSAREVRFPRLVICFFSRTSTQVCITVNLKIAVGTRVGAVLGNNKPVCAQSLPRLACKHIAFYQDLIVAPAMNRLIEEVLVKIVVDVLVTKSSSRPTGAFVLPVVVMVSNVKMAKIDVPELVIVADQGTLPMIMEIVPRHCNPIACANNVALSVIQIWTRSREVARCELVVIDPDTLTVLNSDAIIVNDAANTEVAYNHVGRVENGQTCPCNPCVGSNANQGLIASNSWARREVEGALGIDDGRGSAIDSGQKLWDSCHSDCLASFLVTTCCGSDGIIFSKAY